jgi:hypothetical protein
MVNEKNHAGTFAVICIIYFYRFDVSHQLPLINMYRFYPKLRKHNFENYVLVLTFNNLKLIQIANETDMKVESILRSTVSEETFTILFELLLWINPVKSLCFVTGVHITLFIAYWIISKGILFIVSIILLYKLWKPIWDLEIWPSIQLPGKYHKMTQCH